MRTAILVPLLLNLLAPAIAQTDAEKLQIAIDTAGGVEKLLGKIAGDLSATMPKTIAPNIELRAVSSSGLTMKTVAVFRNVPNRRAFDQTQLKVQAGTAAVCNSTAGQLIQSYGAVVQYEYRAANADVLYHQVIDSAACKQVAVK